MRLLSQSDRNALHHGGLFLIGDFASAVDACQEYSTGYERWCLIGVTYVLVDNIGAPQLAYGYCNLLEPELQMPCYQETNMYLASHYFYTPATIALQCQQYAADSVEVCLAAIEDG